MALGNLLGFGGSSSPGSNSGGGSFGIGNNPKKVIRNVDFKSKDLKERVRNSSPIRAWHKVRVKKDGRMRTEIERDIIAKNKVEHISKHGGKRKIETDHDNNILTVVKGSIRSGQTVSSWKEDINKKHQLKSTNKDGSKVVYHIGGDKMNREKRNELSKIFDPQGPTKKEQKFADKLKETRKNINVSYSIKSSEEADRLKKDRSSGRSRLEKGVDSSHLGIQGKEYKTSSRGKKQSTDDFRGGGQTPNALEGGHVEQNKGANTSFAQGEVGAASIAEGIGAKPQEKDNVIEVDFNKKKESFSSDIL